MLKVYYFILATGLGADEKDFIEYWCFKSYVCPWWDKFKNISSIHTDKIPAISPLNLSDDFPNSKLHDCY